MVIRKHNDLTQKYEKLHGKYNEIVEKLLRTNH